MIFCNIARDVESSSIAINLMDVIMFALMHQNTKCMLETQTGLLNVQKPSWQVIHFSFTSESSGDTNAWFPISSLSIVHSLIIIEDASPIAPIQAITTQTSLHDLA
jgi:hypothetical protein